MEQSSAFGEHELLTDQRLVEDEYEKQYYGFSSTELYADVKTAVRCSIKEAVKTIKSRLEEEGSFSKEVTKKTIDIDLDNLLADFKSLAQTVFKIPPDVALQNVKYCKEPFTDEKVKNLSCEVEKLEEEYVKEQYFLRQCQQEKARIDKIRPFFEKINQLSEEVDAVKDSLQLQEKILELLRTHEDFANYCSEDNRNIMNDPGLTKFM